MKKQSLQKIYNTLQMLNIGESESKLYITSLKYGPLSITQLSKYMRIARPNLYKNIKELEKVGLAEYPSKTKQNKNFVVKPPSVLLDLLRNKKKQLKQIDQTLTDDMPSLLAQYHQGSNLSKIKILTGKEDFLKLFNNIIEESSDTGEFFGSAQDFINLISWEIEKKWIKKRIKNNLKMKVLLLPSKLAEDFKKSDKKQLRTTKILKNIQPFATSFQLFSNKVILWQPNAPLAILIEDEYIVEMFRKIFYYIWKNEK